MRAERGGARTGERKGAIVDLMATGRARSEDVETDCGRLDGGIESGREEETKD